MIPKGLSLLQAPPFSVVAIFFLFGLLHATFGSLLLFLLSFTGRVPLPFATHIFTLGFAANIMLGALFQMLPVVAGAIIENPKPKAYATALVLNVGILLLLVGFYTEHRYVYLFALPLLTLGTLPITSLMLYKLMKIKSYTPTSAGMRYALISFIMGIPVGLAYLLTSRGIIPPIPGLNLLELHLRLMLLGWVGILISSVAFQVIEMFFITPPYPKVIYKLLPPSAVLLILIRPILNHTAIDSLLALLFFSFSIFTIYNLLRRRRKIPDPIVYLWMTGMVFLALSMLVFGTQGMIGEYMLELLLLYGNFTLSVIMAMLYRIVPFLVWFHLSNEGILEAPTMYEVIPRRRIWANFYLHIVSVITSLVCLYIPELLSLTILLYAFSFSLMSLNILSGIRIYYRYKS